MAKVACGAKIAEMQNIYHLMSALRYALGYRDTYHYTLHKLQNRPSTEKSGALFSPQMYHFCIVTRYLEHRC
jgi:hypothetical protein